MKSFFELYEEVKKTAEKKPGEKKLPVKVSSNSAQHYEWVHGKKPSGNGSWAFSTVHPAQHDVRKHDMHVVHSSTYIDAKKKAVAHYKTQGHSGEIHVLT